MNAASLAPDTMLLTTPYSDSVIYLISSLHHFHGQINYGSFRVYIFFFPAVPYSPQPQNSARKITFSHFAFDLA